MAHPGPKNGKRRRRQWRPGEILRFRADADLRPENLTLRLTRVLILEPADWVEDEVCTTREWRQLVRSLVRHQDRYARPDDLEPLPPDEAEGLLKYDRGRYRRPRKSPAMGGTQAGDN